MAESFEVTGISRSGRVRIKSSKLRGYDSGADELETTKHGRYDRKQSRSQLDVGLEYPDNEMDQFETGSQHYSDSDNEVNPYPTNEIFDDSSVETTGSEIDDDLLDENLIPEDDASTSTTTSVPESNLPFSSPMTSTQQAYPFGTKRKPARGGNSVKKDKGKTRFSAYVLWAKDVRPVLMKSHPNYDFAQLSSRLSELWSTVPYAEKYTWKQKAKHLAMLAKNLDNQEDAAAQRTQFRLASIQKKNTPKRAVGRPRTKFQYQVTKQQSAEAPSSATESSRSKLPAKEPKSTPGIGTLTPLNISSHLKLMGSSMSAIAKKMKECKENIEESDNSLSVILDSLLVSAGSLFCLTQQVDEMNIRRQDMFDNILNNSSYIIPGL